MRRAWMLAGVLGLSTTTLQGCGDDEPVTNVRGAGRGASAAAAAAPKSGATKAATEGVVKLPRKLQNADWSTPEGLARSLRNARDPFKPYVDDLVEEEPITAVLPDEQRLETKIQESPERLSLIAIITGTSVHRAMMTDSNQIGHVLRPGDIVGDEVPYRVARITRNEVLFKPIQPPTAEKKLEDVRKPLRSQEELDELLSPEGK